MLIWHGGLPRAGKSYEALVYRIIDALVKGREVVAYVEGIDPARIAQAAGMDEQRVRDLLFILKREDMLTHYEERGKTVRVPLWLKHLRRNALHVFDEAQNFWPNSCKVTDEERQAVAEHGHEGQDIVLMGQSYKDVHTLWRRRLELRCEFVKLSGLGADNRYSVATHRMIDPAADKWEHITTVTRKYDPKYFGTYRSHTDDGVQTGNYKDKRATVFSSWLFRFGVPATAIAAVVGFVYLWRFFHPEPKAAATVVAAPAAASAPAAGGQVAVAVPRAPVAAPAAPDKRSPIERHLSDLSAKYRLRLAGLARVGERVAGVLEWMDGGSRVMERLTLDQLRDMGVAVVVGDGFVRLATGGWTDFATMWPVEGDGRISDNRLASMRTVERKDEPMQTAPISLGGARIEDRPRVAPGEVTEAPQVRPRPPKGA